MAPKLNTTEAPDFVLNDTEGNRVQLSQYRSDKHVVLVFNRGLF